MKAAGYLAIVVLGAGCAPSWLSGDDLGWPGDEAPPEGPFALGGSVRWGLSYVRREMLGDGWHAETEPPGAVSLVRENDEAGFVLLRARFLKEGPVHVVLRDPQDHRVAEWDLEVHPVASVVVSEVAGMPWDDDGATPVRVVAGGDATYGFFGTFQLLVDWLDEDGVVMQGDGLLHASVGGEALPTWCDTRITSDVLARAACLQLREPATSPLTVELAAGDRVLRTLEVELHDADEVDGLALHADDGATRGTGGQVRATPLVAGEPVAGMEVSWTSEGQVLRSRWDEPFDLFVQPGDDPARLGACTQSPNVPSTPGPCASVEVVGVPGYPYVQPCDTGGPAGATATWAGVVLAAAGWRRRTGPTRRR